MKLQLRGSALVLTLDWSTLSTRGATFSLAKKIDPPIFYFASLAVFRTARRRNPSPTKSLQNKYLYEAKYKYPNIIQPSKRQVLANRYKYDTAKESTLQT